LTNAAAGQTDAYREGSIWTVVAGCALVAEAGGTVELKGEFGSDPVTNGLMGMMLASTSRRHPEKPIREVDDDLQYALEDIPKLDAEIGA
jgi:fructose-1,6-bisphosphatase/inositol monophosphatase family enzyme